MPTGDSQSYPAIILLSLLHLQYQEIRNLRTTVKANAGAYYQFARWVIRCISLSNSERLLLLATSVEIEIQVNRPPIDKDI